MLPYKTNQNRGLPLISEIHNKISQTGSNLSDRLEDKLTGDFFGAIRYLPFEIGLKHVLTTTLFSNQNTQVKWLSFISNQKRYDYEMEFWPRQEGGEIDLLITFEDTVIGIEVKYLSGISSEDQEEDIVVDYTQSYNQLARYSRMLEKFSVNKDVYLLFLAPYEMMNTVKKNIEDRSIISPSVQLGFLCWQNILEALKEQELIDLEKGQKLILEDLQLLLTKKGFIRFKGFNDTIFHQPIIKGGYIFQSDMTLTKKTGIGLLK
ncbi:hypothetical protein BKP45_03115 [Anaerobacillus alkalidiazotrophicus]|uniref:Uncharacterized protein n=1 Tax=Anaerobacillus alkalidiazotrophicus TaxID=472963 RepID=A0A1S2MAV9_9BACI|nr:hypothetical protein BKP45_03115 [Anaerobacillus alkalidiazotrophicus]